MCDYKLISIDLDGTLLNEDNKVSKENLCAISKLYEIGVNLVPCTGRSLSEILVEVKNNPSIRYIIYSNGAVVLDKFTNKTLKACINNNTILKLLETLSKFKVHYTIRAKGKCCIEKDSFNLFNVSYYNMIPAHVDVIKNYSTEVENFTSWLTSCEDVEVISIFFHDLDEKKKCINEISKLNDITFVEACDSNLEILSRNAGKGAGLARLCNLLGLEKSNVIGVGDSGNDIPMMQSAGLRIAVSNATDTLKNICDKVVCSNNEHVVDYVLKNIIKNKIN